MKISSKGRYAVRLIVDIAKNENNGYVSLSDSALRQNISIKYLEKIASLLVKNKILSSVRGATGGYKLGKPTNKITVAEILSLTNDMTIASCVSKGDKKCPRCRKCETFNCWEKLNILISGYLNSVTIETLMQEK